MLAFHRLALGAIVLGVLAVCFYVKLAAEEIRGSAAALIRQNHATKQEFENVLTTTYKTILADQITITTSPGDEQGDEPADIYDRHDERVNKAKAKWEPVNKGQ